MTKPDDEKQDPVKTSLAGELDAVKRPHSWDKAVSAAYLRLWGLSQEKAAKGSGLGERTIQRYEVSDWWPKACEEAVDRWMQQLEIECRTTIMAAVKAGDVQTAVRMAERIDPRLAPPKIAHELFGKGGGPIEITAVEHNLSTDEDDDE